MLAWLSRSRKAITAEVAILLAWAGTAYVPDGVVTRPEWYALAIGAAAGLGVYAVPNVLTATQVQEHVASHPEDLPVAPVTVDPAPTMDDTPAPTVLPPGEMAAPAGHDATL